MKFKKKSVVVDAFIWTGGREQEEDPVWLKEAIKDDKVFFTLVGNEDKVASMNIITPEGLMHAKPGDFIIQGVEGEIYPCKPSIFFKTYVPVMEEASVKIGSEELAYVPKENAPGDTSDGSHTFDELYYHRMVLFAAICNQNETYAWKSWFHDDGTMYDDYFIVGIKTSEGDFSYHYHKDHWDVFKVPVYDRAPKWDGHTSKDVTRLLSLL